jgi:hypothetical protein
MVEKISLPKSRMPYNMLRLEGLVIMLASIIMAIYVKTHWLLIIVGFFAFDISLIGYKVNKRVGAIIFNIGHTLSIPIALLLLAILESVPLLLSISLLWIGHIGYDKMRGFGLKYPEDFNDSYLQHI